MEQSKRQIATQCTEAVFAMEQSKRQIATQCTDIAAKDKRDKAAKDKRQ